MVYAKQIPPLNSDKGIDIEKPIILFSQIIVSRSTKKGFKFYDLEDKHHNLLVSCKYKN